MQYQATLDRGLSYRVHRADGALVFEHGIPVEIDEAIKCLLVRDAIDWVSQPSMDIPGAVVSMPIQKFTFSEIPAGATQAAKGSRHHG